MGLSDLVYPASNWDQTTNYRPCAKVPRDQSPSVSGRKSSSAESLRPRTGIPIPGQQLKVTLDKSPPHFSDFELRHGGDSTSCQIDVC